MEKISGRAIKSVSLDTQIKNYDLVHKRRMQIAIGASKLFIEKGYHCTNIRDISKATGITVGSLYDYISKKEDILCLVFDVFHSLVEEIFNESELFKIEDPVQQLKASIEGALKTSEQYADMVALILTESKSLPKEFLKQILKRESIKVRYFERVLRKGMTKGVFDIKDPAIEANMIWYFLFVVPLRRWNLKKTYTTAEIHRYLIDSIVGRICVPVGDRS